MRVTVIAQKPTRHRGRKIAKDERFDVDPRTARIFGALGRARMASEAELGDPVPGRVIATPVPTVSSPPPNDLPDPLAGLRAEYEALTGSAPDRRWGEARLRTGIRDHKSAAIVAAAAKDDANQPGDLL